MPPSRPPQPVRYAIQKARGKGWKTLEVGEDLPTTEARFDLMVRSNPRAYFRLIKLDYNPDSTYEGMEFNWTLIHLHDPRQSGAPVKRAGTRKPTATGRIPAPKERVPIPVRVYLTVVLVGLLLGALAWLRYGTAG